MTTKTAMTSAAPPATVGSDIVPRRVRFEWEQTPMHWVPGDPQTTHTINVLHLLLPAGEKWFVRVYRQALPLITDDSLRADVKGFMGQEAVHSRAHAGVLDHLKAQGLDPDPYTRRVDWLFEKLLGDNPLGRTPPAFIQRAWLKQRLAIIASVEHYTAVLGMWVLNSPALDAAGADPTMLDLLRWHGAEEVEHRSVAFELFEHVSGSYIRRVETMTVSAFALAFLWIQGTRFFMANDPAKPGKATWRGYRRAVRQGRAPSLRQIYGTIPDYLRRSYHPDAHGDTAVAMAYLASSPAVLAAQAA